MADNNDNEIHLILGRVEGKLDSVLTNQTVFAIRISDVEKAIHPLSERIVILETRRSVVRDWIALAAAGAALLYSTWDHIKQVFH